MSDSEGSGSTELPNERAEPPLLIDDTGDYRYLREAYYRSQDLELSGRTVIPSCIEALDAFTPPIALLKASLSHIPVPEHRLVNDAAAVALPALLITVGSATPKYRVVLERDALAPAMHELTRKGTFPVLYANLAAGDTVRELLVAKGRTREPRDGWLAESFFATFKVPLARLLVVDGEAGTRLAAALPVLHARRLRSERREAEAGPAAITGYRARLTRAARM